LEKTSDDSFVASTSDKVLRRRPFPKDSLCEEL
jgi:hypothetical protein